MQRRNFLTALASTASASVCLPSALFGAQRWPSWRGPDRNGYAPKEAWPTSLDDEHLKLQWSVALDDSYSGPIVNESHVFVTETINKKNESTRALKRDDGKQDWIIEWPGYMSVPFFAARNGSWIRSTPATDGSQLFVGGIRDVLVSVDTASGKENWRVDFAALAGGKVPDFGMACSPLVDGSHIYVQAGLGVHKLDAATGKVIWKSMGDDGNIMSSGAFSSPVIAELHGVRQLIVQTRTQLAGINLESGEPLWKYEVAAFRGMNILTPTIWDNAIFTSSYGGRSLLLDVKVGDKWEPKVRWENKSEGYMSSPVVIDDHCYMHLRNRRFACIDLKKGETTWTTRPYGEYWSMITNGQQILALDHDGKLRLIQANPAKFELLSEREVSTEESWAHLALADGQVFVRHQKGLDVYKWA
jgi:outer membrane protein assembly factor BamB